MADTWAVAGAAKWIASSLVEEAMYLYGVKDHVRDLQSDLECMTELLQQVDANPNLLRENGQLRIFTSKIRELAYRAEDTIDSYLVDVGSKIYRDNLFLKFARLASLTFPIRMLRKEIEAIQQEIQKAKERFQAFVIPSTSQKGNISSCLIQEHFIHLDDEVVVGIDADVTHLVHRLIDPDEDFKVLAITGTGGAGKSTLATQIYRHKQIIQWFSHKAFVSVSQQWSRIDLLRRIIKQIKGRDNGIASSESEIVQEIYDFLNNKQCLIVLDDIWHTEAWDAIYPMLPRTRCCRVILTTRKEKVPLHADNKCIIHKPKLLTEDQKWVLFRKLAMEGREHIDKNAEFEKLGRQMLRNCKGLPLALVTLAGILRTKQELYQWEEISNACSENILKGRGHNYGVVEDMMELSYLDLPTHLKPCFLHLAIFPEDWDIHAKVLTHMWVAEGFITNDMRTGQESLEDVALRFLDELAQRCILQVTSREVGGKISGFRVHDLMRELCIKKANECHFLGMVSSTYQHVRGPTQPRRMVSFLSRVNSLAENHHLRTLVCFDVPTYRRPAGAEKDLELVDKKFTLLRVLCISGLQTVVLPEQIGNLIHLRYLGIFDTNIIELPKSIKNLRNLLYFEYPSSISVLGIPENLVRDMKNLRRLVLPSFLSRDSFNSLGLACSTNLQSLSCRAGTWMTKDLPTLSLTVQSLRIKDIRTMEEVQAMYICPGILGDRLCTLACSFSWMKKDLEFDLQKLRNCTTLWSLELHCQLANSSLGIIEFPPNLVNLHLSRSSITERDDLMEVLGKLLRLKHLTLSSKSYLGTQLNCASSAFPQLHELELEGLDNLEEWRMEEGAMSRLIKLRISYCWRLKRLPESIRSISTLKELQVIGMPKNFA